MEARTLVSKKKKAGALVGLAAAIALVGAVVATGLGIEMPKQAGAPITEGVVLGQGFDPDTNQWYFYIADCGGPLTSDNTGDPFTPVNFLPQCHDGTRVNVTPEQWSQYSLGEDYPVK